MKKAINIITTVLLVLVIIIAFCLIGMQLFGFKIYTVLSGSMEPKIWTGSVVYVKEVDVDDLGVDDIITYRINDSTNVTHRIIAIEYPDSENPDKKMFRTKGDNNNDADGLLDPSAVIGKVHFSLPLLGFVAYVMQLPAGKFIAITICVFAVLMTFIPDLILKKDNQEDKQDGEQEN